jgi:hypothetical protein
MKKLSLSLDAPEVQSFTTWEAAQTRGTVRGEQQPPCTCYTCTCPGCPTCDATCPETCWETCNGTCQTECGQSCGETCQRTCYTGRCICYLEP